MKAIILAGGGGVRLWPASREDCPKQLRAVIGGRTMLRVTYDRLRRGLKPSDILVATSSALEKRVREELAELPVRNIIAEPCRRDTAAAVGFAVLHVYAKDPKETFAVINSDGYMTDEREYVRVLKAADHFVSGHPDRVLMVGVKPDYPETGYGYLKIGRPIGHADAAGRYPVYGDGQQIEKPDLATARRFVASGDYLWNPMLLVSQAGHFMGLFHEHLPGHAAAFEKMLPHLGKRGGREKVAKLFAGLKPVSVDFGVLVKVRDLVVLPADFGGWRDVGHWRSVAEAGDETHGGKEHPVISIDSCGNLVRQPAGKLVALVGVSGLVVVDTPDALLICPKERAQDVKHVVAEIKKVKRLSRYL